MKIVKEIISYVIIFLVVILVRTFIVTPVIVSGNSMNDTLKNGDVLLLKKYDNNYDRYEIVIFEHEGEMLVKRVIGLPGETINYIDNELYVNGVVTKDDYADITSDFNMEQLKEDFIPKDYYFVVGDNRNNSVDSRVIGLISKDQIIGSTSFSLWPFKSVK